MQVNEWKAIIKNKGEIMETPIRVDFNAQFFQDLETHKHHAMLNLICSIRDVKLWAEHGMKPHRQWKMSDVKWYFGMDGKGEILHQKLETLYKEIQKAKRITKGK